MNFGCDWLVMVRTVPFLVIIILYEESQGLCFCDDGNVFARSSLIYKLPITSVNYATVHQLLKSVDLAEYHPPNLRWGRDASVFVFISEVRKESRGMGSLKSLLYTFALQ